MKIVISDAPPYFLDLDAPTLPAYEATGEDGTTTWFVWCLYCGDGHRLCHCNNPRSPYQRTGYNLAYRGEWGKCETG